MCVTKSEDVLHLLETLYLYLKQIFDNGLFEKRYVALGIQNGILSSYNHKRKTLQ